MFENKVFNYLIIFQDVASQLTVSEAVKPIVWLNHVWSLVLLDQATHETISGVLEPGFLKKLEGNTSCCGNVHVVIGRCYSNNVE